MKTAIVLAVAVCLAQAAPAFARHTTQQLQVLHEAAGALAPTHPDLAKRLTRYADEEANEKESAEEEGERAEGREQALLKEAADALQHSRPDLADGLRRFESQERSEQERGWNERSERHENERGDVK